MRRLGVAVSAVGLCILAVGVSVWLLTAPLFTQALSQRVSLAEEAGLTRERMVALAEEVRAFVAAGGSALPAVVDGVPAFDDAAVSHLVDVAGVLTAARRATLATAVALVIALVFALRRRRTAEIAASLKWGAVCSAGFVGMALVFALTDFSAFFTAFHGLFFAQGTWTFPSDSLLIRLFPEAFWVTSGVAWGVLVLALAGLYWLAALLLERDVRLAGE